jgi:small ligand-binding sensory domain FIST
MQVISAASRHLETSQAVVQVLEQVQGDLSGAAPDLLCLFVTAEHATRFPVIVQSLRDVWPEACLVGCGASSVIGGGHEVERGPAISLLAIRWANANFTAFHLTEEQLAEAVANPSALLGPVTGGDREPACLMLLTDPFSPGAAGLLPSLDRALPATPVIGGVASGSNTPGTTCLTANGQTHREGVAGVSISGELEVATLVTQGCRPIGAPLFVTNASEQVISTLDGRPPMDILQELFEAGDRRERALLQSSLFLGIQMEPGRSEYQQGDFLVRNLTGVDEERGAIAVAGDVQPNGVVQFHVRDAHTASEDLELALRSQTQLRERLHGALLFSCLGRGEGLYGVPDHDSDRLRERLGPIPIGGFFGNGEIGPVGGRTHLHAYTSAFGLLCAPA